MKTNMPIYRAKKIDSDEYVVGMYLPEYLRPKFLNGSVYDVEYFKNVIQTDRNTYEKIDPSTLSIHFQDMLASDSDRLLPNGEKDLRIFTSLSEDGKGGDILLFNDSIDIRELVTLYNCYTMDLKPINIIKDSYNFLGANIKSEKLKITGIQQ